MNTENQIAKRFREVHLTGRWVANTNFKLILEDVTWEEANQTVGPHNSIALLTFHINYYLAGILNVFEGGQLEIRDKFSFDFEGVESQRDWDKLVEAILDNAEKLAVHIEKMNEDDFDQPFVDPKYGMWRRNLQGIIEHGYYHLGQISLIKKLIRAVNN